jgi:RHS repeat-associated protein
LTQTDPSGTITYTWDARNRLSALTGPTLTASFAYDGLGRRAQKTINSVETAFQYDGLDVVTETSGGSTAAYLRTLGIDEALARTDAVDTGHYVGDALGSTVALSNPAGNMATAYTYEPFGRTEASGTLNANPVRFTEREDDGTGLYYYRARYYDPARSRFVSEDPIVIRDALSLFNVSRARRWRPSHPHRSLRPHHHSDLRCRPTAPPRPIRRKTHVVTSYVVSSFRPGDSPP